MKKTMLKLLCLCLALVFAFSLVACDDKSSSNDTESKTESTASQTASGENKEGEGNQTTQSTPANNDNNAQTTTGIVGNWTGYFSVKDSFNAEMAAEETGDYIKVSSFDLILDCAYNADGTFTWEGNKTATLEAWKTPKAEYIAGMKAYLQTVIDAEGADITIDEYCEAVGLEEQAEAAFGESMYNQLIGDLNISGCYEATNGQLFLWPAGGEKDASSYDNYTISGNQMTIQFTDECDYDNNSAKFVKK